MRVKRERDVNSVHSGLAFGLRALNHGICILTIGKHGVSRLILSQTSVI